MNPIISFFRFLFRAASLFIVTVALLPAQITATAMGSAVARKIPVLFHRIVCGILGVRIYVSGTPSAARPLLIVSNHVSWLDISVISSTAPVVFVAKREVAEWPVFGLLAKLQRSIFVDRERRLKTAATSSEIASRMLGGDAIVLFAEGTSGDGDNILPFRSALIGAATQALAQSPDDAKVFIQPLSIVYVGVGRDVAPWYGDMDFLPHFAGVLRARCLTARLTWGEAMPITAKMDRKEIAKELEGKVRTLTTRAIEQGA